MQPEVRHFSRHPISTAVAGRGFYAANLSIPLLISLNAWSLLNLIDDLRSLLLRRLHHNTGVILVQESWLSNSIDSELIHVPNFSAFRADHPNSKKRRSSGICSQ